MPDWPSIVDALRKSGIGMPDQPAARAVAGGDISAAWRLETEARPLFLKTGPASSRDMFSAEAEGLAELAAPGAVRVPEVIACGVDNDTAFLALEWLEFEQPTRDAEYSLGRQLAQLHDTTRDRFGWHRDNTIGLTPQFNEWSEDWIAFFRERRLGYQLKLAAERGFARELQEQGQRLVKRLPVYFEDYDPAPSLLHGDLWGGNWACCGGEPVIFDPAVYYGDRESDLAMTRLFGGFGPGFYEAYERHSPLAPGHRERCDLYQLYHVLNHVNLFGSAYVGRAQELLCRLLKERR